MHKHNIVFIGFDTHKTFTEVAHIEDFYGVKPVHHKNAKYQLKGFFLRNNITCKVNYNWSN